MPSIQPRCDGAFAASQYDGNFVVGEFFKMFQQNSHSQFWLQTRNRQSNRSIPFALDHLVLDRLSGLRNFRFARAFKRQEPPKRALAVQARIRDHPVEPGGEFGPALELRNVRQQLEKDLLCNVMGRSLVAVKVIESDRIDTILIDFEQQAKSFRIAALARLDGPIVNGSASR